MAPPEGFRTGDEVEVSSDEDGFRGAYFEGRVVRSMPKLRRYTVDYDAIVDDADESRRLRETVDARHVRPRPPRCLPGVGRGVALHQPVDAFHNDAWWVGVVSAVPTGRQRRYHICFPASREEMEFGADELRAHLECVDGEWVLPKSLHVRPCVLHVPIVKFDQLDEVEAFYENGWWPGVITKINAKSWYTVKSIHWDMEREFCHTMLRLRYDLVDGRWTQKPQNMVMMDIGRGKTVEVSSDEEGFLGAWFTATILESMGKNKFLVQYHNLKTDDETQLLTETVHALHIRPTPPEIPVDGEFRNLEEVDASHNDGWWVGVISEVLDGRRYMVYFRPWKEEMEFGHADLRLHQDWINGRWVRASTKLL
ncbi:Agenet domain [Musa troglodytarum]|uniref:Agenet domain n=1 Tax=Musa troglodytarum TaxID=320322 RepID=A0A9E7EME3_9LILI|nr:Agenet domain [Musa troglodytarum]URD79733.1 Agenet domain [Musa troglodytarum]